MNPNVIITCALTGAGDTVGRHPAIPVTPTQIAAAAVEAAAARPGMLVAVTNTECNEMVARSPGAIGPTTLLQVRAEPHPVRPLLWNGVEPTVDNLDSGRYPLGKSIHVVYRTPASDGVRRFLAFLGSSRGRQLLRDLGALPLDFPAVD